MDPAGAEDQGTPMEAVERVATLEALKEQMRVLTEAMHQVKAKSLELERNAEPEPDVPLPERFSGTRAQYPSFLMDCDLLFTLKPRTYARDFVKVRAAIVLMSGRIKAWAHQLLLADDPALLSWEAFVKAMDLWVGQPQKHSGTRAPAAPRRPGRPLEGACHPTLTKPALKRDHPLHPEDPLGEAPMSSSSEAGSDEEEPMVLGCSHSMRPLGEQARRRHLGLCFYCGHSGHFIEFCPVRPPRTVIRNTSQHYPVMGHQSCAYCRPCPIQSRTPTTRVYRSTVHGQFVTPSTVSLPVSAGLVPNGHSGSPIPVPEYSQPQSPNDFDLCPLGDISEDDQPLLDYPEPQLCVSETLGIAMTTPLKAQDPGATFQFTSPVAPAVVAIPPLKPQRPQFGPPVPTLSVVAEPEVEELAPGLVYASNGTLICKEDEEVFEIALKARAKKAKRSKNKRK